MRASPRIIVAATAALSVVAAAAATAAFTPGTSSAATAARPVPPLTAVHPGTPLQHAGGHAAGSQAGVPAIAAGSITGAQSTNWSGYAATHGRTTFRYVSAHFNVPYLDCNGVSASTPTYAAHWVGLDGLRDGTVEQTGLLTACYPNSSGVVEPTYAAWWETYPDRAYYPNITVRPGDSINMNVYYNRSNKKFRLTFSDASNGQHFTRTVGCPSGASCHRSSAEVISEAPASVSGSNVTILPLADYQAAGFGDIQITNTSGSHHGGLTSPGWGAWKITQVSDGTNTDAHGNTIPAGRVLAEPTPAYYRKSFLTYWMPVNAGS